MSEYTCRFCGELNPYSAYKCQTCGKEQGQTNENIDPGYIELRKMEEYHLQMISWNLQEMTRIKEQIYRIVEGRG